MLNEDGEARKALGGTQYASTSTSNARRDSFQPRIKRVIAHGLAADQESSHAPGKERGKVSAQTFSASRNLFFAS